MYVLHGTELKKSMSIIVYGILNIILLHMLYGWMDSWSTVYDCVFICGIDMIFRGAVSAFLFCCCFCLYLIHL